MMASSLEFVPTEVLILILRQLDNTKALFSLIRASSRFLRVYQTDRETIFPNIVANQVTFACLPIAMTTLKLRRMGAGGDATGFREAYRSAVSSSDLSLTDWKSILRHQIIVEEMVQGSMDKTLQALHSNLSSGCLESLETTHSKSETSRVVRGFYNRELLTLIGGRYLRTVEENHDYPNMELILDAAIYRECFASLFSTWALYEFEEVFFVNFYLRARLDQYIRLAEDDQFEEWEANGPYRERCRFEDGKQWIWTASGVGRTVQKDWVGRILYSEQLGMIHQIINETESVARLERLEAYRAIIEHRDVFRRYLDSQLGRYHALSITHLKSPLLPDDWTVGVLPFVDLVRCQFTDTIDGPNLGLVWLCRNSHIVRPDVAKLDRMVAWGVAIWDSSRLQRMEILADDPGSIAAFDHLQGYTDWITDHESVEERARIVENVWIAQGVTDEQWAPEAVPPKRRRLT